MAAPRQSSFGAQLRHHREAAGLSQEDLAERAGLAAKAIGALERGERRRPYPRTVQMLADALQLDAAQRRQLIATIPRSPSSGVAGEDEFVGRDRELGELGAKLRAAAGGRGGIVFIAGEAGIGKTRLAREFVTLARAQGAVVLAGRALEGEGQAPYGPWVEAIERYALDRDPDELLGHAGADAPSIAHLVPALRSRLPEAARPEALAPNDERLRLYAAVTRFCSTIASDGPVVVFLDDVHWADRDTLGLMRYMARTLVASRILLVAAYRDPELGLDAAHPLMTTVASLRHEIACPTIHLGGLGPDEIRAYLRHAAGQTLPPAFVDRVGRETSGNPFYAREVLRHVTETDAPAHAGHGERSFEMKGVPEGVRQVVADRVRRLSAATAQALRDASGFAGGFAFPVLQHLTQLSDDELLDCLDEAVEAGLLRAPVADAREYEFAHAIVRHALYEGQSRDRRIRLHRRIAAALETAHRGDEARHAADLAVHYHASAELAGAGAGLRYALLAADQARAAFAHDRVVTLLRMACDLAGEADVAARIEILTRLALAEAETVRSAEARGSAEHALSLMETAGTTGRARAGFLAAVVLALKQSGADAQLWSPLIDRGLALVDGERDALWARLTLLRDRYEGLRSGAIGSGLWTGQDADAVATARRSENEDDYASTLEALEWRTRAQTDAIHARVRTWSQPLALLKGLEVVVRDLVYKHGDYTEGKRAAEELLTLALRFGSVSAEAEARTQIGCCVLSTGDFAATRSLLAETDQAVARLGPSHRLHLVPIGFSVGLGYFVDAEWTAVAQMTETYARATDTQRTPVGLVFAAYTAVALVRANRLADARSWLRDLAAASERAQPTTYLQNWVLVAGSAAAWEAGFREPAATFRRQLLDVARTGAGDPASYGTIDLSLARMAALLGEDDEAQERFGRASQQAERRGHRALGAIVAFDQALALSRARDRDERIPSLIARAESTFEALEMRSWLKRARSLDPSRSVARRGR